MIIATDGVSSASLPLFNIAVGAAATNAAPTIAGSPLKSAQVGVAYSFKPTAADANKDALTFSVQNKPSWATFNTTTGQLSGTPNTAGVTGNILISVSDGKASAALAGFTITVAVAPPPSTGGSAMISWSPPTTYTDGSTMSNLAGYRVHYGQSASALNSVATVNNAGVASYTVEGLTPGVWYFAVSAYTSEGG